MEEQRKLLLAIVVIDLFILNIISGYLLHQKLTTDNDRPEVMISDEIDLHPETEESAATSCSTECSRIVDEKLANFMIAQQSTDTDDRVEDEVKIQPTQAISQEKKRSVSYVPIPGSGNTLNNDWVTLQGTDFYLSKSDYAGLQEVYFEANMYLKNGNGKAYLRIFDVTHGVGADGSQIETSSQDSTFVSSGKVNLWDGYNHYVVQARSLTADTTYFESGRLKIIQEN